MTPAGAGTGAKDMSLPVRELSEEEKLWKSLTGGQKVLTWIKDHQIVTVTSGCVLSLSFSSSMSVGNAFSPTYHLAWYTAGCFQSA